MFATPGRTAFNSRTGTAILLFLIGYSRRLTSNVIVKEATFGQDLEQKETLNQPEDEANPCHLWLTWH